MKALILSEVDLSPQPSSQQTRTPGGPRSDTFARILEEHLERGEEGVRESRPTASSEEGGGDEVDEKSPSAGEMKARRPRKGEDRVRSEGREERMGEDVPVGKKGEKPPIRKDAAKNREVPMDPRSTKGEKPKQPVSLRHSALLKDAPAPERGDESRSGDKGRTENTKSPHADRVASSFVSVGPAFADSSSDKALPRSKEGEDVRTKGAAPVKEPRSIKPIVIEVIRERSVAGKAEGEPSSKAPSKAAQEDLRALSREHLPSGEDPILDPLVFRGKEGDFQQIRTPQNPSPSDLSIVQRQLLSSLREAGNDEIVRQARLVLRDQEKGDIHLVLRPPSLGRVRIHVEVTEGRLSGRILVENMVVKEAFQQNLNDLLQHFKSQGFQVGQFLVDVEGGNGSFSPQRDPSSEEPEAGPMRVVVPHGVLEHAVPAADEVYETTTINLTV
ncbi:flagellar hook-length control protein [Spirochaeta thermophila DSM 6578]|uniref:Flagellar hook-length control protein n=1 Tax=Winmispira thermophila (strain ATCC 700085 / DSM 6578 / Z-1203) TaxID=869211 RepID=G0GCD0_WINT7|nr:flagellar hook-length control protein FliK [Spirochaeta thermophila]AEJ61215.1 flagellar hook-length control protein [Spirochaeta thermophila DSM 6578]